MVLVPMKVKYRERERGVMAGRWGKEIYKSEITLRKLIV